MRLPQIVEAKGIRVLTTKQIAEEYGAREIQISQNFTNNRSRFIEGKHYISLSGDELRAFKKHFEKIELVNSRTSHLYLWTEKGALLHAKSLNTDKAWEVYDYLVDFYFRAKEQPQSQPPEPQTYREKREAALAEARKKEAEHVAKPLMIEVVDMPQNVEGQKIIQDIRKRIYAMEVLLDESNRYASKESFHECRDGISRAFMSLVPLMTSFYKFEPKLIEKPY